MRRYKRLQNSAYKQSLLIMMIILFADVFSFFIVKGILSNTNNGYHISIDPIPVTSKRFLQADGYWAPEDFAFDGNKLDNSDKSLNTPVSISWIDTVSDLKSQMIFCFTEPDLTRLSDNDKKIAISYLKSLIGTNFTLKSVKEDKSDNQIFVNNVISGVDDNGKVTFKGKCTPVSLISMTKNDVSSTFNYAKNLVLSISVSDGYENSLSDVISNIFKLEKLGLRFKIEGNVYSTAAAQDSKNDLNQKVDNNNEIVKNDTNNEVKKVNKKKWIWEHNSLNYESKEDSEEIKNNESFVKCFRNKHKNKEISNTIGKSNLKETSENLIIDIIPLLLIGCVILFKRKELFELKYSH